METFANFISFIMDWLMSLFFSLENKTRVDGEGDGNVKAERYEYKYIEKFDKVKEKNDGNLCVSEPNFKNNFVMDNTPYGNVIMNYDKENELFMYYCDKRDIPYKYLETVARKYVINNKCLSLYVDIRDELRNKKMDVDVVALKDGEKEDGVKNEKMKNVFATFKKKTGKNSVSSKNDKKNKVVFKEQLNKYKFGGRFGEFSIMEVEQRNYAMMQNNAKQPIEISFADFKSGKR